MRVAAVALLLALFGVFASESALAQKRGGSVARPATGGSPVKTTPSFRTSAPVSGQRHFNGHHHGHGVAFVGVGFGFWPWYYPPYYYPYPYPYYEPVAYPAQPVTYVEQYAPAEPTGWWYYCEPTRTYYPYVRECPSGWLRVPATPPR